MKLLRMMLGAALAVTLMASLLVGGALAVAPLLPYGQQIAYMGNKDNQYDLFLYDISRRQTYQLTSTPFSNERYPEWSPDGRYIAFHANPLSDYDLFVMDTSDWSIYRMAFYATYGEMQFTDEAMVNWSPDGEKLAFHAGMRESSYGLYLTNARGTTLQRLTQDDGDYVHVYWSPDSTQIIYVQYEFASSTTDGTIYTMDIEALFSDDEAAMDIAIMPLVRGIFPAWSPDGSAVAYVSNETGVDEIYLLDLLSEEIIQLTFGSPFFQSTTPDWTPDGRIIFSSNRMGTFDVYSMARDGSDVRRLTDTPYDAQAPAWRP